MIPLTSAWKGSISSAKPSGENILQGYLSITGLSLGSILMRWSMALDRISVVESLMAGALDGDIVSRGGRVIRRCVSGVTRGALVPKGSARRSRGTGCASLSSGLYGSDIMLAAAGVGVMGGKIVLALLLVRGGVAGGASLAACLDDFGAVFFFLGGASLSPEGGSGEGSSRTVFRFLEAEVFVSNGGPESLGAPDFTFLVLALLVVAPLIFLVAFATGLSVVAGWPSCSALTEAALSRAERLEDIVIYLVDDRFKTLDNGGEFCVNSCSRCSLISHCKQEVASYQGLHGPAMNAYILRHWT
jgi:hypothetical protein